MQEAGRSDMPIPGRVSQAQRVRVSPGQSPANSARPELTAKALSIASSLPTVEGGGASRRPGPSERARGGDEMDIFGFACSQMREQAFVPRFNPFNWN